MTPEACEHGNIIAPSRSCIPCETAEATAIHGRIQVAISEAAYSKDRDVRTTYAQEASKLAGELYRLTRKGYNR